MPPPAAARRASSRNSPTISSVGPKPSSSSARSEVPFVVGLALISTPFSLSSADSCELFQKEGISVLNCLVVVAFLAFGG